MRYRSGYFVSMVLLVFALGGCLLSRGVVEPGGPGIDDPGIDESAAILFDFVASENWRVLNTTQANATLQYEYDQQLKRDVMRVDYSFQTAGSSAIQLAPDITKVGFPEVDAIRLIYKGNGTDTGLQVRLKDSSGQMFAPKARHYTTTEGWTEAVFSYVDTPYFWSGNNDGVMVPPIYVEHVFLNNYTPILLDGKPLYFDRLEVVRDRSAWAAADPTTNLIPDFVANLVSPHATDDGGLHLQILEVGRNQPTTPDANEKLAVLILNSSDRKRDLLLSLDQRRLLSDYRVGEDLQVSLDPGEMQTLQFQASFTDLGVHEVKVTVFEASEQLMWAGTVVNVWEPVGNDWEDVYPTFFGTMEPLDARNISMFRVAEDIALMREVGVKIVRFLLRWSYVESQEGVCQWDRYDYIFQELERNNIIPYVILDRPPTWAVAPEILQNAPPRTISYFPYVGEYLGFVSRAVERYKNYTHYWQIWNEPYAPQYFWGGTAEDYAALLCSAYAVIKDIDPTAVVNSGAVSLALDARDYGETVAANARGYFDNWTFHAHTPVIDVHRRLETIKEVLGNDFPYQDIWLDESGWNPDPNVLGGELEKTAIVLQKLIVSRAYGLGNYTWFVFNNPGDDYGSFDDLTRMRPVILGYNVAVTALRNTVCVQEYDLSSIGGEAYLFERPNEKVFAAWGSRFFENQVRLTFPPGVVTATLYDMFGHYEEIAIEQSYSLDLGAYPVFLILHDGVAPQTVTIW